jgi:phosphatidylserine/phosphatidylglycerophosphate/cardiolipin synthase-like enzyme
VSFAVYRVRAVAAALAKAVERGVDLRLIAETPESGEGKIAFGPAATFGQEISRKARVYVWPREKRPTDGHGRHGSLHAKCAVADGRSVFLSSANLTDYAMTLNMEMGVLVTNEGLAQQILRHVGALIRDGVLQESDLGTNQ